MAPPRPLLLPALALGLLFSPAAWLLRPAASPRLQRLEVVRRRAEAAPQRRAALLAGLAAPLALARNEAKAEPLGKVAVLGGSGFVGSRICEKLVAQGAQVVSLSRRGGPPKGAGAWAEKVTWLAGDVLAEGGADLAKAVEGADVVISSIGAIGSADDARGNGATNEAAVAAAAGAKAKRFVLVSASGQVATAGLDAVFGGYIEGKKRAEAAVKQSFAGSYLVLQPTFIYGGEEFSATPPRVAGWYGEKVEGLLDSGLFRGVAGAAGGFLKLALSPPNAVEEVAAAAVAGALGQAEGTLADHDQIKAAAAKV